MDEFKLIKNYFQKLTKNNPSALKLNDDVFFDKRNRIVLSIDSYNEKLSFPGEFPYTRGIHPNMYRGKLWTMRLFAGFGSPKETNERFKLLLSQGQTGLSVAFDMPTLMGYDADDKISNGEIGHCGVSISSLEDPYFFNKNL